VITDEECPRETAFIVSPANKVWSLKSKLCSSWSFISKILTFTTSLNNFTNDTRQTNILVILQGIITISITERVKGFQKNDSFCYKEGSAIYF